MFRYRIVENYAFTKVKLVIGPVSVQAKVAPHPLFDQVKEIYLKNDELNSKCLQLVQQGQVLIASSKCNQFVKRCKQVLNFTPQLNIQEIGVNMLLGNSQQDTKTLDILEINDLLSVIKLGFDNIGEKLHPKVMRKLKTYIKNSNRRQSQKQIIDSIIKSYKQNQKIEEEVQQQYQPVSKKQNKPKQLKSVKSEPVSGQKQKSIKRPVKQAKEEQQNQDDDQNIKEKQNGKQLTPAQIRKNKRNVQKNKKNDNKNGIQQNNYANQGSRQNQYSRRNQSRSNRNSGSKDRRNFSRNQETSREKYDPKIILGITGDTEAGWRQRNRPPRVPINNEPQRSNNKIRDQKQSYKPKVQPRQQTKKNESRQTIKNDKIYQPQSKVQKKPIRTSTQPKVIIDNGSMQLVFTYPKDGVNFDFTEVKQNFKLFVNGSFWVTFKDKSLEIKKGQDGYIRDSNVDIISNGIMAEGLTIRLGDSSNLEDGGDMIGNPTIDLFTGTQSQFFHVIILQVYAPVKGQKQINNKVQPQVKQQIKKPKQQNKQIFENQAQECQRQETRQQKQEKLLKKEQTIQQTKQIKQTKIQKDNIKKQQVVQSKQLKPQTVELKTKSKTSNKKQSRKNRKKSQNSSAHDQNDWQDVSDTHQIQHEQVKVEKNPINKKDRKNKQLAQKAQQYQDKLDRQIKEGLRKPRGQDKSRSKSRSSRNSNRSNKSNQKSPAKIKQNIDPEILLGINGSTQAGWRQRNRPRHVYAGNTLNVQSKSTNQNQGQTKQENDDIDQN